MTLGLVNFLGKWFQINISSSSSTSQTTLQLTRSVRMVIMLNDFTDIKIVCSLLAMTVKVADTSCTRFVIELMAWGSLIIPLYIPTFSTRIPSRLSTILTLLTLQINVSPTRASCWLHEVTRTFAAYPGTIGDGRMMQLYPAVLSSFKQLVQLSSFKVCCRETVKSLAGTPTDCWPHLYQRFCGVRYLAYFCFLNLKMLWKWKDKTNRQYNMVMRGLAWLRQSNWGVLWLPLVYIRSKRQFKWIVWNVWPCAFISCV